MRFRKNKTLTISDLSLLVLRKRTQSQVKLGSALKMWRFSESNASLLCNGAVPYTCLLPLCSASPSIKGCLRSFSVDTELDPHSRKATFTGRPTTYTVHISSLAFRWENTKKKTASGASISYTFTRSLHSPTPKKGSWLFKRRRQPVNFSCDPRPTLEFKWFCCTRKDCLNATRRLSY
jgi:hypothetical protein